MDKLTRILLLEDQFDDANLIERELKRQDLPCDLRRVETRQEYVAALPEFLPDLILSDHKLPGFDGLSALKLARQHDPSVPFILISGVLGEELAVETLKCGATDYVLKDRLFRLGPAVRRALQEYEERRGRRVAEQQIALLVDAIESAGDLIVMADAQGRFTFANCAFLETYGYALEEILGRTPEILQPQDMPEWLRRHIWKQTLRGCWNGELLTTRKDGAAFPIDLTTSTIRDRDGGLAGFLGVARDISELKRTEAALRESEERFRRLAETTKVIPWEADAGTGQFTYVGPQMAEFLGYPVDEWYAPDFWPKCIYPDDREYAVNFCLESARHVTNFEFEYRMIAADGRIVWVHDVVNVVRQAGEVRLRGFLIDLTERKRSEEALRQSEERFRMLFECAPLGIALHDAKGRYIQTNRAYQEMLGFTAEELLRLNVRQLTHREDAPQETAFFKKSRQTQQLDHFRRETRYVHRDGSVVWAQAAAFAVRNTSGELQHIISIVEDITERKRAEAALLQSEGRNRALLDAIPDFILRIHRDGTVLDLKSPRGQKPVASEAKWIGQRVSALPLLLLGRQAMHYVALALQTGETQVAEFEWPDRRDLRYFELRVVESGPDEVLAIIRDITERKRLEREILEISAREQRRIGQDLHDGVGQLLTGVAFMSKALEESLGERCLPEAAQAAEIGRFVQRAIGQTRSLSRGLLQVELGGGLCPALQELCHTTSKMFSISCSFQADGVVGVVDDTVAVQLYRIAQEALSNAAKHSRARHIVARFRRKDHEIELSIADDGIGLSEARQETNTLGLRIMNYRARSIGATMEITGIPGGGTRVTCRLAHAPSKKLKGVYESKENNRPSGAKNTHSSRR